MTVLFFFSATALEIFLSVLHSPWTVPAVPAFDRGAAAAGIEGGGAGGGGGGGGGAG
ncbi:hypothetical protein HMPREF9577_01394, partial [Cutibacterium acnes HL110PA3]